MPVTREGSVNVVSYWKAGEFTKTSSSFLRGGRLYTKLQKNLRSGGEYFDTEQKITKGRSSQENQSCGGAGTYEPGGRKRRQTITTS